MVMQISRQKQQSSRRRTRGQCSHGVPVYSPAFAMSTIYRLVTEARGQNARRDDVIFLLSA